MRNSSSSIACTNDNVSCTNKRTTDLAAAQVVSSNTLTVQLFSAEMDKVFVENLRKRSFQALENIGHHVCRHVEVGLDHVSDSTTVFG